MAIGFEVRHWKACDQVGEEVAAIQRATWQGGWDWTENLARHSPQKHLALGWRLEKVQSPSDDPVRVPKYQ
jgi:hypothetical protein